MVIVDAGRQITYLLVPDQKVYLESGTFGTVYTTGLRLTRRSGASVREIQGIRDAAEMQEAWE